MAKENSKIFDEILLKSNLKRALKQKNTYLNNGFLYEHVANELLDRISNPHNKDEFKNIAEPGFRNPTLSELITKNNKQIKYDAFIECNELKSLSNNNKIMFKPFNEFEKQNLNSNYDLILNNLTFSVYNQLPQILMELNRLLKKGGLIKGAILGEGSLFELKQSFYEAETKLINGISPKIAPFVGIKDLGNLLTKCGFTEVITDRDVINISYSTPYKLLKEIKSQGLANPLLNRSKTPMRKSILNEALKFYQNNFKVSDKSDAINVRLEIIYYSALKA